MILPSTALRMTHVGVPPSSAATHREKDVILGVDGQACRPVALFTEVEMTGHLEGFGVHHGDVVRVGYVKIEMSLAVRDALLDGGIGAVRADGLHLAGDRTVLGIDHEQVRGTVTQNKKVVGRGVEDIAVRTRGRKGLDHFKCLRVEKSRGIADDQAGMVFRVDRDAMPGRLGQSARELVGIEVEDTDRIAAGDINPAVDAVRRNVVNPPGGGNLRGGKNLVGLGRGVVGRQRLARDRRTPTGRVRPLSSVLGISGKLFHVISPGANEHVVIDQTTLQQARSGGKLDSSPLS